MSYTRQCSVCGHPEHLDHSCGVGTLQCYPTQAGVRQRMCECDGIHKESIIENKKKAEQERWK